MQDSSGFDKVPNPPTDNDWPTGMPRPTVVGQRVGPYKLLQEIGEGGGGKVFLAEQDQPVRRRVALKIIKLGMDTEEIIARFEAERQALAMMDHPNIARVFDAGATETGRPYFVMELVRGEPITKFCDDNKLSIAERLKLFILVCNAVQHAHQKGIIHRDIKPSNVLVAMHDGVPTPKIIDFGIAKATGGRLTDKTYYTAIEQFVGTPAYMSPEQAAVSNVDVDTRSDIYSLGVLLYQLLTGCTPLDYEKLQEAGVDEIRRAIREEEPHRPSTRVGAIGREELAAMAKARGTEPVKLAVSLRGDLDWIVMRCLEKDRARRYDSASALAQDLQHFLANEPVSARPPNALYLLQKMARRHRVMFVSVTAISLALVLGLGAAIWSAHQESIQRERADNLAAVAQKEMENARTAKVETEQALGRTDYLLALNLAQDDRLPEALAHLVRALHASPGNQPAATLLNSILAAHDWLVPISEVETTAAPSPPGNRRGGNPGGRGAGGNNGGIPGQRGALAVTSPDGKLVFRSGGINSAAQIFDAVSGRAVFEPLHHDGGIVAVEWSDSWHLIVKSRVGRPGSRDSKETITTWGFVPDVGLLRRLDVNTSWLSLSPDGKFLLTGLPGNSAQVWQTETGQAVGQPLPHEQTVRTAFFSPDSQRVATVTSNNTLRVWDTLTGAPLTPPVNDDTARNEQGRGQNGPPGRGGPNGRGGAFSRASFSPDGQRILSVAADRAVQVMDIPPGAQPLTFGSAISSASYSPDGAKILTTGALAQIWSAATGKMITEFGKDEGPFSSASFSSDGRNVLTTSPTEAQVWNAATGESIGDPMQKGEQPVSASFSPDGTRVLTYTRAPNVAQVWDAVTGQPVSAQMQGEGVAVQTPAAPGRPAAFTASFSADGRWVITSGATSRVWDANTGLAVSMPMTGREAQLSSDGKSLFVLGDDGAVRIWPFNDATGPAWILDLAEKLAQCRLDATGSLVFYPGKPMEELRKLAAQEKDAGQPMVVWAKKLLGLTPGKN